MVLLAMFARHACDRVGATSLGDRAAVAKLKRGSDSVVELLIRGGHECATDRGCGAKRRSAGTINDLGADLCVLAPPSHLHPDLGRSGSRSRCVALPLGSTIATISS